LKAKTENEPFDEPAPTAEVGRQVAPEFTQPRSADLLQEKPKKSKLEHIRGGFFTAIGAVKSVGIKAKDNIGKSKVGKTIAGAASTAGHFVVDNTKKAATAVKRQGSKIAVSCSL